MKIADIALARFRTKLMGNESALESAGSKPKLPKQALSLYSAPETFSFREHTTASDIYGTFYHGFQSACCLFTWCWFFSAFVLGFLTHFGFFLRSWNYSVGIGHKILFKEI